MNQKTTDKYDDEAGCNVPETLQIRVFPDDVLRRSCAPLEKITELEVEKLRAMLDFMYESDGVGLAGPQVGWSRQVVTIDTEGAGKGERIFVNPRIVSREGESIAEEGCLSIPGVVAPVKRAEIVKVIAYTLEGERREIEAEGLAARAWQHEVDHLNGVLFVDRLGTAAQFKVRKQLKELQKAYQSGY
jgi:peptide deformylase